MRTAIIGCALWFIASSAFAALSNDEVKRLSQGAAILTELRNSPDKGIPEQLWNNAQCVIVIPSLKKAAFIVGGEAGSGVMSCRTKDWSAPVFMHLAKGSWGLQAGAEEIDLVLLVMNRGGIEKLLGDKVSLGADVSVAAGPVGRSGNASTDAKMSAEMLSYSRSHGVFAGIDLSGGVLKPDKEGNARAYGADVNPRDVVTGTRHVEAPAPASAFMRALQQDVRATTGQKPGQ
jgi:SH3 domain-containing YSC84-like protein 1